MSFRLKYGILFGVSIVTFLVGYGVVAHAVTWPIQPYNRNSSYGYFLNTHDNDGTYVFPADSDTPGCSAASGDAIPSSVNTASEFIAFIKCKLASTNNYAPYVKQEKTGAAFIIQTMIGTSTTKPPTAAQITNWTNQVNYAAAHGYITWSTTYSYTYNSFYQDKYTGTNPDDDAFFGDTDSAASIVFKNEAGTVIYAIRRQCANPVGNTFKALDYNWTLAGTTNTSPTTVTSVNAGQVITWTNTVKNTGTTAPADFTWYIRYCWDACSGSYTSGYTQYTTGSQTGLTAGSTFTAANWAYTTTAAHTKMCVWIDFTNSAGVNTGENHSSMKCVTIVAATPSCGVMTITPSPVDPSDVYTIHSSVQVTGGQAQANTVVAAGAKYFVHISGPGAPTNNDNVTPMTTGTSGTYGTISTDYTPGAMNGAGTYSVTWGITGTTAISCGPQTFGIAYSPYFSVVGGDIAAGPGFGGGSCDVSTANIESWNNNTSSAPNYFGGGSEFGAFATGDITNFVSGLGLVGNASPPTIAGFIAPPNSGHGLSFANSSNSETNTPSNYGGGNDVLPCIDDYFGGESSGTSVWPGLSPNPASQITSAGMATISGAKELDPDGVTGYATLGDSSHTAISIAAGKAITLYVPGDLYIDSNITYAAYTLATVPRLNVYVSGNVYIDPAVTELHGVYIAQASDVAEGDITTCGTPTATTEPYATCNKKLTVVGSMAAEGHLNLARTYGNLSAVAATSVPAEPAEVFQYNPEMWLNAPAFTGLDVKSYTSLPPVL